MTDKTLGACQCHEKHAPTYWKGIFREYKDALEKAEQKMEDQRAEITELWPFRKRADRAERDLATAQFEAATLRADRDAAEEERDEALLALSYAKLKAAAAPAIAHTMNAARLLAPEDIRQLVRRNRFRVADAIRALYPEEPASTWEIERVITAALTEPPARPEGAEDIERLLTEDLGDFRPPVTPEAIADLLAARGVRVVTEEDPR